MSVPTDTLPIAIYFSNRCEICQKVFPRKADLSAHMSQHKAVDTKRFTCDKCGKIWKSKYRLDVHKRSHGEKIARTFPCNFCNRKYAMKFTHSLSVTIHLYSFSLIRFSTEQLQKSHIFRIHEADKDPKTEICEYCAKTFTTRKEVLSHIRSIHTDNSIRREKMQCQICSAWLSNRYTLKEHMVRHNSGPQKCEQCDKISPNQHALCKCIQLTIYFTIIILFYLRDATIIENLLLLNSSVPRSRSAL